MAKNNPNDESMRLNFVPEVFDPKAEEYRPIYIAPDATDEVRGDVLLSDAVDGTENAMFGTTAATPLAVRRVHESTEGKLDKLTLESQEVLSDVKFYGKVSGNFFGDLEGTARDAKKLTEPREFTIKSGEYEAKGSYPFDGSRDIDFDLKELDASTVKGKLPLETIPSEAMSKLFRFATKQEAIDKNQANINDGGNPLFQEGDTILATTERVMYYVDSSGGLVKYLAEKNAVVSNAQPTDEGTVIWVKP